MNETCQYCCGSGWRRMHTTTTHAPPRFGGDGTIHHVTQRRCGWCHGTGKLEQPKPEEAATAVADEGGRGKEAHVPTPPE